MSNADAQVINMVNAPHEARARKEKASKARKRRQMQFQRFLLTMALKLELFILALGLIFIATAHGWVAGWLGTVGMAITIAAGAIELWQHMDLGG